MAVVWPLVDCFGGRDVNTRVDVEKGDDYRNHFTVGQLAAYLNVTTRTVRRWVSEGKIPQPADRSPTGWSLWTPDQARQILDWRLGRRRSAT